MRPAKLLFSAIPLFIAAVAAAQPQSEPKDPAAAPPAPPSANNPGTVQRDVSFSRDGDTVTKNVGTTLPNGKASELTKSWTKSNGQVNMNAAFAGPNGKSASANANWSKANGAVTRTSNATGPNGREVHKSTSWANDAAIKRQIHAITGPAGERVAGQSNRNLVKSGITREALGNIPDTRSVAAQIAACRAVGVSSSGSSSPASNAAPSNASVQADRAQRMNDQPDAPGNFASRHDRPADASNDAPSSDTSRTIDRAKPDFLPGQGSQPGTVVAPREKAPTATSVSPMRSKAARAKAAKN